MTVYAITDTKKRRTGIAPTYLQTTLSLKVYFNKLFISTNEQLMYKFYKNCNYFIFK